jgi:DNA-binding NtrC family response regulator
LTDHTKLNNKQHVATVLSMSNKATIMVVDDEPDLLNITTRMLEKDGYQVHAFDNPKKHWRTLRTIVTTAASL